MEHYDFVCDEGLTSLRIMQRNPADCSHPITGVSVHIRCSDCVAGLSVDTKDWAGFVRLFTHDYETCGSAAWISTAGEWQLQIERNHDGILAVSSTLNSLLDFHRWTLHTSFNLSPERFIATRQGVLDFVGAWK